MSPPLHPQAIRHLRRADKTLARLISRVGPCTLKPRTRTQPYQALVRAVTYQQLNSTAAEAILKRVLALYPGMRFPAPRRLLETPDNRLRAAGLSGAKTAAVKDIAAKTLEGIVPGLRAIDRLSDEEIVERLTRVRGVGPWTVEMLLMFTLGRMDVLPATDYGIRKGFALIYGRDELPAPKEILRHGEPWRPYRTIASWYLWRALDLAD
jgi:3-methyladenine DNA glycosylase/8-oxoguanine DNA glycosylase